MKIKCADRLGIFLTKQKRIKILVGGRASTKSTFISDVVLAKTSKGQRWCCAREFQASIDDSVHSLLNDEIDRCKFTGFDILRTEINHLSGGKIFYKGLARNITSLKGINCHGIWIEEGESLSAQTIKILTASIRKTAKQVQEEKETGEFIADPEIWVSMNRGSSLDPIADKFLKRAEPELEANGYYEDDYMMIIDINYTENPWFKESGLEVERLDDVDNMSKDEYEHKWLGRYSDTIEGAIIKKEWFDAAVDAHVKLGITPTGAVVASHDPADEGEDSKAYAIRKGILITEAGEITAKDGNESCDIATALAINANADLFVWDADGMGALLRRQIGESFKGIKCELRAYRGSNEVEDKKQIYEGLGSLGGKDKPKTNGDTFYNKRAQYGIKLAQRFYNTYLAVVKGKYIDPDTIISIDSKIQLINKLRSEVCRIPRKANGNGKIQLMSKKEMFDKYSIASPGMYDCLTMAMEIPDNTSDLVVTTEFDSIW
ncbi:phage terminase large subunit [Candidatus Babeliales bacterium]|nr:phage terminase large subunit [Candidatus Babeliales bacterium]